MNGLSSGMPSRRWVCLLLVLGVLSTSFAAELMKVPSQFATIQAAIDAAKAGDTVWVAAGEYRERLKMKPRITVRSVGKDAKGKLGLARAEATIPR